MCLHGKVETRSIVGMVALGLAAGACKDAQGGLKQVLRIGVRGRRPAPLPHGHVAKGVDPPTFKYWLK